MIHAAATAEIEEFPLEGNEESDGTGIVKYFYLDPEVAGGFGEGSVLDTSVHPQYLDEIAEWHKHRVRMGGVQPPSSQAATHRP